MPDGNTLLAAVGETTLGRGQLQSIDYPKGELHRFTNDLSDYTAALDVTQDGKTLAAHSAHPNIQHLDCTGSGFIASSPADLGRSRLHSDRTRSIRQNSGHRYER